MTYYLKLYAATFLGFLAIDIVWLAFVARGFYKRQLGFLLSDQPNWWAAIIFYLLFIAGLLVFAVGPGLQAGSDAAGHLLGVACVRPVQYERFLQGVPFVAAPAAVPVSTKCRRDSSVRSRTAQPLRRW